MQHGLPIYMHDREGHTVPGRQVDMGTREVLLLVVTRERRENALTSSGLWPGALASTPISSSNDKSYKAMSKFQSRRGASSAASPQIMQKRKLPPLFQNCAFVLGGCKVQDLVPSQRQMWSLQPPGRQAASILGLASYGQCPPLHCRLTIQ